MTFRLFFVKNFTKSEFYLRFLWFMEVILKYCTLKRIQINNFRKNSRIDMSKFNVLFRFKYFRTKIINRRCFYHSYLFYEKIKYTLACDFSVLES